MNGLSLNIHLEFKKRFPRFYHYLISLFFELFVVFFLYFFFQNLQLETKFNNMNVYEFIILGEFFFRIPFLIFSYPLLSFIEMKRGGGIEFLKLSERPNAMIFHNAFGKLLPEFVKMLLIIFLIFSFSLVELESFDFLSALASLILWIPFFIGLSAICLALHISFGRGGQLINKGFYFLSLLSGLYFPLNWEGKLRYLQEWNFISSYLSTSRALATGQSFSELPVFWWCLGPFLLWGGLRFLRARIAKKDLRAFSMDPY